MGDLVFVTARDCHLCSHGRPIVERLARSMGSSVRELDWDDDEASALTGRDGVPFPPALYLDGHLIGFGRLSERRLRTLTRAVPA